ncbi:hypothetical protein TOPH_01193 [Tolypocladium ophioglossoides CBS 100239]|uniref:RBR-type E3 ubiquitin transferase n=1 Tax=Tolypocladium ophioglossoides (strain CBS 100239) TaxID=1163406 RepID=A0A0L0NIV8_TOLOC|nr:hypothetical protein TOPH_01193 [Tolypocladium ophioglossoides CBS 100239]
MFRSLKKKVEAALRGRKSPKTLGPPTTTDPSTSTRTHCREPSVQTEQSVVPPEAEASLLRFQEEPAPEAGEEQDPDPFAPKYMPFAEASVAKGNMLGLNTSRYGRVNPAIMEGFGGDDDSIWLVDDEETDEEAEAAALGTAKPETPDSNPPMDQPGPSDEHSSRLGFRYQTSTGLLDDDFATPAPATTSNSQTVPATQTPPAQTTAARQPGYGPISSSILAGFDSADELEAPPPRAAQELVVVSDGPASTNPYVALCEQQDRAMTVAYLRRLDQCGDDGGELADDFRLWTEIRCPECKELLEYVDIQRFADAVTFLRYEALALRAAMSQADSFTWCTSGCGSGQIHESGREQPIVTCLHCHHRSCFQHNVPWHENLSCDEYDRLLADPENFRSRIEMENEKLSQAQRAQVDADRAMAQGLLAEDQAEARRREERSREERERAIKAAALARRIIARRQREERQSRETVSKTTRPCPGCGWAIEKNEGWPSPPHRISRDKPKPTTIAGIKCRHEFCWSCHETWTGGHNINCVNYRF